MHTHSRLSVKFGALIYPKQGKFIGNIHQLQETCVSRVTFALRIPHLVLSEELFTDSQCGNRQNRRAVNTPTMTN